MVPSFFCRGEQTNTSLFLNALGLQHLYGNQQLSQVAHGMFGSMKQQSLHGRRQGFSAHGPRFTQAGFGSGFKLFYRLLYLLFHRFYQGARGTIMLGRFRF
jgi:hypothetical protein